MKCENCDIWTAFEVDTVDLWQRGECESAVMCEKREYEHLYFLWWSKLYNEHNVYSLS